MSIRTLLAFALLLGAASVAAAQGPNSINCFAAATPPLARLEGRAEQVGDVILNCTGGDPDQVYFIDFALFFNTNVTSDIVDTATNRTEALMLIDEPQPGVSNLSNGMTYMGQVRGLPGVAPGFGGGPGLPDSGNVYSGFRMADNQIKFPSVPYVPAGPGKVRVLRIVNVRVDATNFTPGPDAKVTALIAVNGLHVSLIGSSQVTVANVVPSLAVDALDDGLGFQLRFRELIPSAFQKRVENTAEGPLSVQQQGDPANHGLFTESGFVPDYAGLGPGAEGMADTGTRLVGQFNSLPDGVFLAAPRSVRSQFPGIGGPATLEARRVTGFDADFAGGTLMESSDTFDLVPSVNGQATVVYEVVAFDPPYMGVNGATDQEEFHIPIQISFAGTTSLGNASVSLGYAPINATNVMSGPAPEPRFGATYPLHHDFELDARPDVDDQAFFEWNIGDPVPIIRDREDPPGTDPILTNTIQLIQQTGGAWLAATASDIPLTNRLILAANPTGLNTGTYNAAIVYRRQSTPEILRVIPAVMVVNPRPEINLPFDSQFTFEMFEGDPAPEPKVLYVSSRYHTLNFTISVSTANGGNWLHVSPLAGFSPSNITVAVDPSGLGAGTYNGALSFRADNAANSPLIFPVTLHISKHAPSFAAQDIYNAASQVTGGVSPGEMVTFKGTGIGPAQPAGLQVVAGRLATIVAGTRILFDGVPAPLIAVSSTQSTAIVPYRVRDHQTVTIVIEFEGTPSAPVQASVVAASPGLFTLNFTGLGPAAIVNQDGTINSPDNPASRGTIVMVYLTGAGETFPFGDEGAINSLTMPPAPVVPLEFRIDGKLQHVAWQGGAPGGVAGFIQANVVIGQDVTPGPAVPIEAISGNTVSRIGATIAVE